jgi:polysaccharide export outer membrane protein
MRQRAKRKKPRGAEQEMKMIATGQKYRKRTVSVSICSIGIVILLGAAVCASSAQQKQEPPVTTTQAPAEPPAGTEERADQPALHQRNPRYQLCKGDTFDLTFPFTPEFNQTVTVQPDGYIALASLGDLFVAGRTVPELRELLKTAYGKVLHDPVINLVLKDLQKPYFYAGGDVGHPGKYELREDITLTQAIAIAGGFTTSSKHSQVLLFRRVSSEWASARIINVKKMFQAGNLTEDLHLQPGDMFFVPQNTISKIKPWIPYTTVGANFFPAQF